MTKPLKFVFETGESARTLHVKKVLIKSFLLGFVLLLSGFGCLCSPANQKNVTGLATKIIRYSPAYGKGAVKNSMLPIIKPEAGGSEGENSEPEEMVAEYEEDESGSFRRNSESSNFMMVLSDVVLFRYFNPHVSGSLLFSSNAFHLPSHKSYLLFRVFRV